MEIEGATSIQNFDSGILEALFIQLFQIYNFKNQKFNFKFISQFCLTCKLFLKISKQTLFSKIVGIKFNLPFNLHLKLSCVEKKIQKANHNQVDINTFFFYSCKKGFYSLADIFLQHGANINHLHNDESPLIYAVSQSKVSSIKYLISHQATNVNLKNQGSHSALEIACSKPYSEVLPLLLSRTDLDVNIQNATAHTALLIACLRSDKKTVSTLLGRNDLDVNLNLLRRSSPLIQSCHNYDVDIISLLLTRPDLDLNLQPQWCTALMVVCLGDQKKSTKLQIQTASLLFSRMDLNLNLQDGSGMTALMFAVGSDNQEIVSLFCTRKDNLNLNLQNQNGETVAHLAMGGKKPNFKICSLLMSNENLNLNIKDQNGNTPLLLLFKKTFIKENLNIFSLFLNRKDLDLNIQNNNGDTVLMMTTNQQLNSITFDLISNFDINFNIQNTNGETPLIIASKFDYKDTVSLLIFQKNLNLNIQNNDGDTALMIILKNKYFHMIEDFLIQKNKIDFGLKNNLGKSTLDLIQDSQNKDLIKLFSL